MSFFELINKRESVRGYLDKPDEREKIEKIIECARLSTSSSFLPKWYKISKNLYDPLIGGINKFALTAPVFIVVVGEKRNLTSKIGSVVKNKDYTSMDIGIACENICLAATELGLGTCMMGWFKEKGIKKILEIPDKKEIHLVISLGYHENKEPRKKVRKEINEIFSYNKYE